VRQHFERNPGKRGIHHSRSQKATANVGLAPVRYTITPYKRQRQKSTSQGTVSDLFKRFARAQSHIVALANNRIDFGVLGRAQL
jgi:hypothetical protein